MGVVFGRDGRVFLSLAGGNCCLCQLLNPSKPMLIGDLGGSGEVFVRVVARLCPPRSLCMVVTIGRLQNTQK